MFAEIVSLDKKHDDGIKLFMPIHDLNEISWVLLCKDLSDMNDGVVETRRCSPPEHT